LDLQAYLQERKKRIDEALETYLPEIEGPAAQAVRAMRYSLFAGGKRLRPILCLAGAEAVGSDGDPVLPVACALELIHTYSLIHDDLPVMDDDDLRRGKPTSHKVFGDAMALLAGDGLLTEAFRLMVRQDRPGRTSPPVLLNVIGLIAEAAGYGGMVGGQVVDIQSEGQDVDMSTVEFIHTHKTGALIRASVVSGAMLGDGNRSQVEALTVYGRSIGLAFQIADDILDIVGDTETLGKTAGMDQKKRKITYPSLVGLDRSRDIQENLVQQAVAALKIFDDRAAPLHEIARFIIGRTA